MNFPTEENIKNHKGSPIVPDGVDGASILDAFDLFFPISLITLIVRKTNQRAAILSSRDNLPKFMLDWFNVMNSEFYVFLVLFLFMSWVTLPSEREYFSTDIIGHSLLPP